MRRLAGGRRHGLAFASGLAAEDNVLRLLHAGDRVLLGNDAYGGTFRLISKVHTRLDVDGGRPHRHRSTSPPTGPTTPSWCGWRRRPTRCCACFDIEAIAEIAHDRGALVCVDNTFATPFLQQPLALGADIVVHSATKYLGGHSDVVGGFLAVDDDELAERLRFTQNAAGAVPAPFDCYLVLRGVKTLAVRMERHCANARAIVDLLVGHPAVERVLYPQLPDHPGPRRGGQADARLRRDGQLHAARRRARRRCGWPQRPSCSRSPSRSARSRA